MQTQPFPVRPEGTADLVATGLADPSLTLIENGPALGVLVAAGCQEDRGTGRLVLERVLWARGDEAVRALRHFPRVQLYQAEPGIWLAEEVATGRLFPRPSRLPYQVLFLPGSDYEDLVQGTGAGDVQTILAFARARFGRLPGFRLVGAQILAPEGYAGAEAPPAREYVREAATG